MLPVILVVAVTAFIITNVIPGDPVRLMLGDFATEEQIIEMKSNLGFDQPLWRRFIIWFFNIIRGDLGDSLFLRTSVSRAIITRLEPTIILAILGQFFALLIGVPLGVLAAVKRKSILGKIASLLAIGGLSIPSFWLAISLILLFGVNLGWLPVAGYRFISEGGFGFLRYSVLPAISIGVMHSGLLARMTRSAMLDVLSQDYIRTAKAKGLTIYKTVIKHALRNAFIPVLTVVGASFSMLLAGTWIIEVVYDIPGTGSLAINAIMRRDYPLIQGAIVFVAFIYLIINLIVDLAYVFFDPQIRLD